MKINSTFLILHSTFCILLLLTGCARFRPLPPSPRVSILPVSLTGGVVVATQYAHSTTPRTGCNTAEIYLENHGTNPLVFQSASLNGKTLPPIRPKTSASCLETVTLDGEKIPLGETDLPKDREVVWWQFYPSPELKPGETVVCQVNFRATPTSQRKLELRDLSDKSYAVTVPRFRQPETLITAITYPLDYSKVYIQYQSQHIPPAKVWLNNHEVVGFTLLPSPESDTPDMVMVPCHAPDAQFPITTGIPLHVKLQFPNGSVRQALVRAMSGVLVDAYALNSGKDRKDLLLDPDPPVLNFKAAGGGDVACCDSKKKDHGASAAAIIEERQERFQEEKSRLLAIHYCTAMYPELWNIYGQISDASFANPYRLGWGKNPARFIEEDEDCIIKAWQAGRPRPFLWIPEAFKGKERFLEAQELEVMAWMTLMRGCKGIKYYGIQDGLAGTPPSLVEAMKNLNRRIHEKLDILSPLMLVSERIIRYSGAGSQSSAVGNESTGNREPGTKNLQPSSINIYTAWSGDRGLLIMARNLDYQTDDKADDEGRAPRFHANPKPHVTLSVLLPEWFQCGRVTDFISEARLNARKSKRQVDIILDRIEAFSLVWIENRNAIGKGWFE